MVVAGPESVIGFDRNTDSCQALPIQLRCIGASPKPTRHRAWAGMRYCQKLWMGLAQAASFLMPSTKGTPLMTSTIN